MSRTAPPDRHRTRVVALAVTLGAVAVALAAAVPVAAGPARPAQLTADRPVVDEALLGITGELPGEPLPAAGPLGTGTSAETVASAPAVGTAPAGTVAPAGATSGPLGIPGVVLDAYQRAERTLAASRPGCHLSWTLLAAIGRVESGHASGGRVDAAGRTLGPILGPRLDGSPGVAAIRDTDGGAFDGDTVWDRAVGPMQFIPSTWRTYRADGNGDGVGDPHNVYDATLAAGAYLCAGGDDLADQFGLSAAVFRYNRSVAYVRTVIAWASAYAGGGVVPTVSLPGTVPAPTDTGGTPPIPPDNVVAFVRASSVAPSPVVGALGCTPRCGPPATLVPVPPAPSGPLPTLPTAPPPAGPPTPPPSTPPPSTALPVTGPTVPPPTTAPPTTPPRGAEGAPSPTSPSPTTIPPATGSPTVTPAPLPTASPTAPPTPQPTTTEGQTTAPSSSPGPAEPSTSAAETATGETASTETTTPEPVPAPDPSSTSTATSESAPATG